MFVDCVQKSQATMFQIRIITCGYNCCCVDNYWNY